MQRAHVPRGVRVGGDVGEGFAGRARRREGGRVESGGPADQEEVGGVQRGSGLVASPARCAEVAEAEAGLAEGGDG